MLNNSHKDKENLWKFYRTDAWLIFIDDQSLPVPFNCWSLLTSWVTRSDAANESAVYPFLLLYYWLVSENNTHF